MGKRKDLSGQIFGRLYVKGESCKTRNNSGRSVIMYSCECSCGNTLEVSSRNLLVGDVKSCGCLRSDIATAQAKEMGVNHGGSNKLEKGVAAFNHLFSKYKRNATRRGLEFNISELQFRQLTEGDCFYCGVAPHRSEGGKYANGRYLYNGVDRKDNALGYQEDNVVTCCWDCNLAKGQKTTEEFISHISKIHAKHVCKLNNIVV